MMDLDSQRFRCLVDETTYTCLTDRTINTCLAMQALRFLFDVEPVDLA